MTDQGSDEVHDTREHKIEQAREAAKQSVLTDIATGLTALSKRTKELRKDVKELEDATSERAKVFWVSIALLAMMVLTSIGFWVYTLQVRNSVAMQACESTNALADSIIEILAHAGDDPNETPEEQRREQQFREGAIENIEAAKC